MTMWVENGIGEGNALLLRVNNEGISDNVKCEETPEGIKSPGHAVI